MVAIALLATSGTAPALLLPHWFLADVPSMGVPDAAPAPASDGPSVDALYAFTGNPPASQAFGVYVSAVSSAVAAGAPTAGPAPLAEAETTNGFGDQLAVAGDVFVRSIDGTEVLVDATALRSFAVARTVVSPDHKNVTRYWAAQARAESHVEHVALLDGDIVAKGITSVVFASANQRNASAAFRLDASQSHIRELRVFGQAFAISAMLDGSLNYSLPANLGYLTVNETRVDAAAGTITNYGLRLHLNANNMDVIVAAATVKVARQPLGPAEVCTTWTDAYPTGDLGRIGDDVADTKHNWVLGDPPQGITKLKGYVNNVPVDSFPSIGRPGVMRADSEAVSTTEGADAKASASVTAISLLNGAIVADEVKGVATARTVHTPGTSLAEASAEGSVLVNLRVQGTAIDATPAPNTHLPVIIGDDLVADLWLNEQTTQVSNEAGVQLALQRTNMLRLVITTHNLAPSLPFGTQLVLGHAVAITVCGAELPPRVFGDPLGIAPPK